MSKVPLTSYLELEIKYERLYEQLQEILNFIKDNDPVSAYEYAVKENLV